MTGLLIKLPNGVDATCVDVGVWSCPVPGVADALAATFVEPADGYSPDPVRDYAKAVAKQIGARIVKDTRPDTYVPGRIY